MDLSGGVVDTVDIYNELTDSWSIEHLPIPVGFIGAASLGTNVYFAGGFQPVIQVFDTVSRTWTLLRTPGPNRLHLKVVADERWVCVGAGGGVGNAGQLIDVFDSWTSSWTQVVAPADMLSIALEAGRLRMTSCAVGLPEHVLYEYDLEAQTWTLRRRPTDRCAPSSASIGPFTVLANGLLPGNTVYPDAEVYNRLTDRWQITPLSIAARERVTVVHEQSGSIFVIGGQTTGSALSIIDRIDIFRADPAIGISFCSPSAANSTGHSALIEAAGRVSVADNWFSLGLSGAPPGQIAMFLIGSQATAGTIPPGAQGSLCLGGTVERLVDTLGVIRADGSHGSALDLGLPGSPTGAISAGETWHFQAWFRDANPGPTTNFTDALSVTFE